MGNTVVKESVQAAAQITSIGGSAEVVPVAAEKPKCKACCACPETKRVRDQWYNDFVSCAQIFIVC